MEILNKIFRFILYPIIYIRHRYIYWYSLHYPKKMVSKRYKKMFGQDINWKNPESLNEKIIWLEFNTDTTKWSELTDKYKVREYVESCGLGSILVKLYAVWWIGEGVNKIDDINFDKLPNSFVLKTNNSSGDIIIVKDKTQVNLDNIKLQIKKTLKRRHGILECEPHYLRIKPCIIAEELLPIDNTISSSIVDYKIWCFNGKPFICYVCGNRDAKTHGRCHNFYDIKTWKIYPEYILPDYAPPFFISKPKKLDILIESAAKLSKGFKEVRVDFYYINEKIYFGEMTFTACNGLIPYYTSEFQKIMGSQFDIE